MMYIREDTTFTVQYTGPENLELLGVNLYLYVFYIALQNVLPWFWKVFLYFCNVLTFQTLYY